MKAILVTIALVFTGMFSQAAVVGNNNVQVMEYEYDFAKSGGAVGFINLATALKKDLPVGAIITDVHYYVETAFTSGGAATVAIGDASAGAVYKAATAFGDATYAAGFVAKAAIGSPNYLAVANEGKFGITVATAALTAGKVKFLVSFMQLKR